MSAWLTGLRVVVSLELRQRVRGVAWYVLLGVFTGIVALVTLVLAVALGGWVSSTDDAIGNGIYSALIYFVLLLASLVAPALSGNAINGDRDAGTLATTQVTLITTPQLVLGKWISAWLSSLAFLAAAVPFLLISWAFRGLDLGAVVVSVLVLAVELGVIAAIGVGLSGLLRRGLFSIVVTYLTVAMLSVGTLIAFGLAMLTVTSTYEVRYPEYDYSEPPEFRYDPETGETIYPEQTEPECTLGPPQDVTVPRSDLVWWLLAANPYVVLADATPTVYDGRDQVSDLFGFIKIGVRMLQQDPDPSDNLTCESYIGIVDSPSARETIESTVPSWFVGLAIHIGLGAAALAGAIATTRTPSRKLAAGSRVA